MSEASAPLLVELFLSNGRVHGITHEVHDRTRLLDVLTDGQRAFRLDSAKVLLGASPKVREFGSLNVEKRSIVAAIPHETQAQLRHRSMQTTTVGKSPTRPIQATLLLPPFVAEGRMHVSQSIGNIGRHLSADAGIFASFISVTDARLFLPGGTEVEAPVLLVNRDLIAGISLDEQRNAEGSMRESA
jgi:hypothetical protein